MHKSAKSRVGISARAGVVTAESDLALYWATRPAAEKVNTYMREHRRSGCERLLRASQQRRELWCSREEMTVDIAGFDVLYIADFYFNRSDCICAKPVGKVIENEIKNVRLVLFFSEIVQLD